MNFLAHFYLSSSDTELLRGGFFGDFVKGPLTGKYPPALERGIRLHRFIDSFTDQHPAQQAIKPKLPSVFLRFSGIVTDMMCDHFLAKRWPDYHHISLVDFNRQCMATLAKDTDTYNDQAKLVLARMNEHQWLLNYVELDYVTACLGRIGARIRFDNPLHKSGEVLPEICDQLEGDCLEIFNDTRIAVTQWLQKNTLEPQA